MNLNTVKYSVKNCQSCLPPEADANRMILYTNACVVVLRKDQHGSRGWLGRAVCYVIGHLNPEEALVIAQERMRCERIHFIACQRLLGATRGNYAEAGNMNKDEEGKPTSDSFFHHPHSHILPRYKKGINWRDKQFVDHTFNKPMDLDPTPSEIEKKLNEEGKVNIPLTEEEIVLLKSDIQKELVRMIFDEKVPKPFQPKWEDIYRAYPPNEVTELYYSLLK